MALPRVRHAYESGVARPSASAGTDRARLFCFFDFSAPVTVEVRVLSKLVEKVEAGPAAYGIHPIVEGGLVRFTLEKPQRFTLEINGFHNPLHIFSSPVKDYGLLSEDPDVVYFPLEFTK